MKKLIFFTCIIFFSIKGQAANDNTAQIVCLSAIGVTGICCYIGYLAQITGKKLQLASNGLEISYNF